MHGQRNSIQNMSRLLSQELKKPKVRLDLDNEDFSEDLQNLFKDPYPEDSIPIVRQQRTFKNVTFDYNIDNIKENNICYYFNTIKEAVRNTINNFKGNDNTKFKIIIT